MKYAQRIVALVFTVATCSVSILSQTTSVTKLPVGTKFTSEKCGYSVPLPAVNERVETAENPHTVMATAEWTFTEGVIAITCSETQTVSVQSDAQLKTFLDNFRKAFTSPPTIFTVTSEVPTGLGVYRGVILHFTRKDQLKNEMRVLTWGTKAFTVRAAAFGEPANLAALKKAADGFAPLPPKK